MNTEKIIIAIVIAIALLIGAFYLSHVVAVSPDSKSISERVTLRTGRLL